MKWTSVLYATSLVLAAAVCASAQRQPALDDCTQCSLQMPTSTLLRHWPDRSLGVPAKLPAVSGDIDPALFVNHQVAERIRGVSFYSNLGGDDDACCSKGCVGHCCCPPVWAHRTGLFAEFLYLRPRDAEVAYAVPIDGGINPPPGAPVAQLGPVAITDPDYSPGYRVGGMLSLDDCTSIVASWSRLETNTNHSIDINPPLALRALVLHPENANAVADFLTAFANHDVDFDLVDVGYRSVLNAGDLWAVSYSVGTRYGRLEQDFQGLFTNAGTTDTIVTDIEFDGAGFRLGLDFERHACNHGFMAYGKFFGSLLGGEFNATYLEGSDVDPVIVSTSWEAGRVVPILEIELGGGWQSPCGHFRFTSGYMFSAWFNTVNTDEWIQAVHGNNFTGLAEAVTFDGYVLRGEYRF